MNKVWSAAPFVLAALALAVVLWQRAQVVELGERLENLSSVEPRTREIVRERVIQLPTGEPGAPAAAEPSAEPAQAELVGAAEFDALSARFDAVERRLSLAMTVLDGITSRRTDPDAPDPRALAAELVVIRAELDALHDAQADAAAAADAPPEPVAAPEPAPAPPPPPTLAERWRSHRDAADKVWLDGVTAAAELRPEQAEGLQGIVGGMRSRQEATLQAVWRGDKSLIDAQIELDELERETSRQLDRLLSGSQRRALQHRQTTYPSPGWSY